ncbi:MAG: succinate dehydrogenase assembly factor 2 [Arenicellales bacterium]|nr:succinate dehydrogenase assembly factor 2 [Arenicellales bacterium]
MRSKILWRCRRGAKELDSLLTDFFNRRFDQLSADQKDAFCLLLEQPDPLIMDWLWGRLPPPENNLGGIVMMVRQNSKE